MEHSALLRTLGVLSAAVCTFLIAIPAQAHPIVPITLSYEREGLDLDSGTIVPIELPLSRVDHGDGQPDVVLAFNAERTVRVVVFHNQMNGGQLAFLDGVAFNMADTADLSR